MDSYKTIKGSAEASYEVQKSRFITHVSHAESEEEAREFIQQMKKKYFDARHNCSAWVLGEKGAKQKSNDDGEPGGTAGNPILEAIKKNGLTDIVIVVTRYFGGIKLGAGGLIRAYGHAAVLGIQAAQTVRMMPLRRVRINGRCRHLCLGGFFHENFPRQDASHAGRRIQGRQVQGK